MKQGTIDFVNNSINEWYGFVGTLFSSTLDFVLHTPEWILDNEQVTMLWWIFVGITVSFLSMMCIIEAALIMLGKSSTKFLQTMIRTATSFTAIGFILPAMTWGLYFINFLVDFILGKMGHVDVVASFSTSLTGSLAMGAVNFLSSLVFLVLFIWYLFKILLYYGRRWFDIIHHAVISPLAIGASIFNSTTGYFQSWWTKILNLYLIQVHHAVFVLILGVFVLKPESANTPKEAFVRILILLGALWKMSNPEQIVGPMADGKTNEMVKSIINKVPAGKVMKMFGKGK